MIVVELTAAIDAAGTLKTFYVSDGHFITASGDTPASTAFEAALTNPGALGINMFSSGAVSGATQLETGEIEIANADGAFDAWKDYGFDGRAVTIRHSENPGAYPGSFTTLFTGTLKGVEVYWKKVVVRLKDKQDVFSKPALPNKYAGNNALPAGLEGTAADLKGQAKPRVLGKVFNITPPLVNTSKLTYQVSDTAVATIVVYDQGVALTNGGDFATSALLQAAAPAAGQYITCLAEGYFRLGATPAGVVTADVIQGASGANRTAAQLLKTLAGLAGLNTTTEVSAADVTAMDTAAAYECGVWITGTDQFLDVMDQLALGVNAWFGFDQAGVLRMGVFSVPSGTPAYTLQSFDFNDDIERQPPADTTLPVWGVTLNYAKNYTNQSQDLAGSVTGARRAVLMLDTLTSRSEDTSIKTQFLNAQDITIDGRLTTAADAATVSASILAQRKVTRDVFELALPLATFSGNSMWLSSVVSLVVGRFGLQGGKSFRIIGVRFELQYKRVRLTLWG